MTQPVAEKIGEWRYDEIEGLQEKGESQWWRVTSMAAAWKHNAVVSELRAALAKMEVNGLTAMQWSIKYGEQRADTIKAEAALARARDALGKVIFEFKSYAQHTVDCAVFQKRECDCGLPDAFKLIDGLDAARKDG